MTYRQCLFWPLLAIVFWLPLPMGSNPPWARAILILLIAVLSLFWVLGYALNRLETTASFRQVKWLHAGFTGVIGWLFVQQLPMSAAWVQLLSPFSWNLHSSAAETLGLVTPQWMTLSISPHDTMVSALLTMAYYLFFCLCLLLVDRPDKLRWFAWAFVVSGIFQAVFGSLSTLSGAEVLLFGEKPSYFGVATGTYVNRNSFAGCMEMTLAFGMGLLIAQLNDRKAGSWQEWLRETLHMLMSNKVILRTGLAIMVIGLVLSRSRMGNTAFFSSLLVTGLLFVICRKQLSRGMIVLFVSLLLIDTAILSQWFGLEKVMERIEQTSLERETRPNVSEVTLGAISDYSLTGSGAGSFYTALPAYHDGSWKGFYDLAHNDFLQFPLEFGVPVFLILALMVVWSSWQAVQAMKLRRSRLMIGMGFSSFMGMLAIVIHSSVDFNLQIPANAAYFVALMALAVLARNLPSGIRRSAGIKGNG
ncbi:O-antigen ligase family protein [Endozoicomonas sp. ALE010]|uniref:O-antigen ligase family protein n=1 Tax=Endozoicomonas sp. ALE010 TaxID=3403081 RepID=UPI003BB48CD8